MKKVYMIIDSYTMYTQVYLDYNQAKECFVNHIKSIL